MDVTRHLNIQLLVDKLWNSEPTMTVQNRPLRVRMCVHRFWVFVIADENSILLIHSSECYITFAFAPKWLKRVYFFYVCLKLRSKWSNVSTFGGCVSREFQICNNTILVEIHETSAVSIYHFLFHIPPKNGFWWFLFVVYGKHIQIDLFLLSANFKWQNEMHRTILRFNCIAPAQ